ncbi:hypothetical protein OC834_002669 [Tilletia horrida]|uniref:Glutathione S-transferase 3, mitochondrial n=1 Tax=Tilletia horrida TaxID=155126 RepID=A0AAN6GBU5_9BASI|nr:hypothetical protein OC834_002669 [Tilletia horrida]KAK0532908.1 hypothetical protein OC842_003153 [Tilletia horrida]KAK0540846.1 hypothetical protein OC835_000438 [Tilletia horrida]KAK0561110.1 hypothetical protein OC844_003384 [Tilletia horrida]
MALILTVPPAYGWVGLSAFGAVLISSWQTVLVGAARKAAGIKYPQLYAEKAEAEKSRAAHVFNCTQRAHANTLEVLPSYIISTLIAGLKAPRAASLLGATWLLSRILYTRGYTTGDPRKREPGAIPGFVALLGLYGVAIWSLYDLIARNDFKF